MKSKHNREPKKVCICPKCGELHALNARGPMTSIVFKEHICTRCVLKVQKTMDIPARVYA